MGGTRRTIFGNDRPSRSIPDGQESKRGFERVAQPSNAAQYPAQIRLEPGAIRLGFPH
jgi:hypothetical protein